MSGMIGLRLQIIFFLKDYSNLHYNYYFPQTLPYFWAENMTKLVGKKQ
jgi:hypothetical protein